MKNNMTSESEAKRICDIYAYLLGAKKEAMEYLITQAIREAVYQTKIDLKKKDK